MPVDATDMYMFAHPIDGMTHGIGFQSAQRNGDRVIKQLTRNFGFGLECFVKDVSQPFSNQLIDDKGVFLDNSRLGGLSKQRQRSRGICAFVADLSRVYVHWRPATERVRDPNTCKNRGCRFVELFVTGT